MRSTIFDVDLACFPRAGWLVLAGSGTGAAVKGAGEKKAQRS